MKYSYFIPMLTGVSTVEENIKYQGHKMILPGKFTKALPGVSWKEKIKKKRIEVGRKSIILEVENKSYLACRLPFHDSLTLMFLAILSFNLNFLLIFGNFMPCPSVLPISLSSHSPLHTCNTAAPQ